MKSYKEVIAQVLVVIMFVVVMTAIAVGVAQKKAERKQENNEVCVEVEENNVITINTTIMNAIDKSIDLNTIRIEQMFVIDTYIDEDTNDFVSVLEDNSGHVWECINMDFYLYEDVLVLLSNNNTIDNVEDDVFIHYWIGVE